MEYNITEYNNKNIKSVAMAQINDSRVEFFNSESSFGSSSMISCSQVHFGQEQIIHDMEQIFSAIKSCLLPRQDLTSRQQLDHIVHRAKILHHNTVPQEYRRLTDKHKTHTHLSASVESLSRALEQLIHNYELYLSKRMPYQKFYQIYTQPHPDIKFTKSKPRDNSGGYPAIQPDIVNIIQSKIRGGPKLVSKQMIVDTGRLSSHRDKQISELQEEIDKLKKKLQSQTIQSQIAEKDLRFQTGERIRKLLVIHHSEKWPEAIQSLKEQLLSNQMDLMREKQNIQQAHQKIHALEFQIEDLLNRNRILSDELQSSRKLGNSRISQIGSEHDKSVMSEFDGAQAGENRKLQKTAKNLQYQNSMLKMELQRERNLLKDTTKMKNFDMENENRALKKNLQEKTKQLTECKSEMDRLRVEMVKLADQIQQYRKHAELAILEVNSAAIQRQSMTSDYSGSNFAQSRADFKEGKQLGRFTQDQPVARYTVQAYKGDGNEYSPYYELLNRQFKIRFKRSCLKEKELLHKANGLEIGVISQFMPSNEIKVCLHLSNFCNQNHIRNLRLKISNGRGNRISLDKVSIDSLKIGEQIKNVVVANAKFYPLGCSALICEYEYLGQTEEVRVILPVHIFKMLMFRPRDGEFKAQKVITIPGERKIIKDGNNLYGYFKGASKVENIIKSTIIHEQTETKIICDIEYDPKTGRVKLTYEHRSGEEELCEYIMRSISFLLGKEEGV